MIQHIWSVLTESSSIDTTTNNLSLFSVLEQIQIEVVKVRESVALPPSEAERIPFPVPATLVTMWRRSPAGVPERGRCRLQITSDDGKVLGTGRPADVNLTTHDRLRMRTSIQSIPLAVPEPGSRQDQTIWFTMQLEKGENWETQASIPLEVNLTVTPIEASSEAEKASGSSEPS